MTKEQTKEEIRQSIQARFRTFNRIEKAFYLSLLVTGLAMAISIIYLHSRAQQIEQEISAINRDINEQKIALNEAKQEVNELARLERIAQIAQNAGLTSQNGNLEKVD